MLKVDHVVFPVWKVKESLCFYRDVLGFALVQTDSGSNWSGYPWLMTIFSPGDGRKIVLVALRGARKPKQDGMARDVRHLAFAVSSLRALGNWRRKLRAARLDFWEEAHGRQKSLYFEDPNGIVLEITTPPSRASGKTAQTALTRELERA